MGNKIPDKIIEQLKNANDIVDIIGEYVQLKKQGKNFFGLCPFHDEKTPSFSVAQDKQIFHCFGCKKGGNVITFLMEIENFSFQQTLHFLSERSGIKIPTNINQQDSTEENQADENILSAYNWLTRLYHHLLRFSKEGKRGLEYFRKRGISEESIDKFQLGYAPNIDTFVADFLIKKGFNKQFLIHQGILSVQENGITNDPFRGRVIFPIRNPLGRTIAFGGRSLTGMQPKYINSSESKLFQKSKLIYNFDLARKAARKDRKMILFEGQMDVIAADQIGVENSIATLGTSLTSFQARLLNRYVDEMIISYDADQAGFDAAYRAANLLRDHGHQVRIVRLPNGYDPDDYINEYGGESFRGLIKNSETYISFLMDYLKKDFDLSIENERISYVQKVLKELAMVKSTVEREYYLKDLSETYNISLPSLLDEIKQYEHYDKKNKKKRYPDSYSNTRHTFKGNARLLPAHVNAENILIAYMLQNKYVAEKVQAELSVNFNFDNHKVIVTHLYGYYEAGNDPDVSLFVQRIVDPEIKQLVTQLGMISVNEHINEQEINDYISIIRKHNDRSTIEYYKKQQREAEQANDPIKAAKIAMKIIQLKRDLKQVK